MSTWRGPSNRRTAVRLARRHGLSGLLPTSDPARLAGWFEFTDFADFIRVIVTIQKLIRTADDFALVAYQAGADMAAQNIRYRELTVSPYNHTHVFDKGLVIGDIINGLDAGRSRAKADFGVEMRWVFDISRNFAFPRPDGIYDPEPADITLKYALAGQAHGVIALGIGGDERGRPPEPFAHAFRRAGREGLRSVPHAGESLEPWAADHVRGSIDALEADRIGHGIGAIRGSPPPRRPGRPGHTLGGMPHQQPQDPRVRTAGPSPLPAPRPDGRGGHRQQR